MDLLERNVSKEVRLSSRWEENGNFVVRNDSLNCIFLETIFAPFLNKKKKFGLP